MFMKIILGSSSEGRKLVMQELGLPFEVMSPDIDEKEIRDNDPEKLVIKIAEAKAKALMVQINEAALLITADSVGICNGEIFEKPQTREQALYYFDKYKTFPLELISGVAVTNTSNGKQAKGVEKAKIYFKSVPNDFLEKYIESGRPFKGAGGFMVHDEEIKPFIDHIDGAYDTVTGLSKDLVLRLIEEVK